MSATEKKCCVPGCNENGTTQPVAHGFPNPRKEKERFNSWVMAIGGDLLNLKDDYIYGNRRVCRAHFEVKYLCRYNRISHIAIPTLNMPPPTSLPNSTCKMPSTLQDEVYADNNTTKNNLSVEEKRNRMVTWISGLLENVSEQDLHSASLEIADAIKKYIKSK